MIWNITNSYKLVGIGPAREMAESLVYLSFLEAFRKSLIISVLMRLRNEWGIDGPEAVEQMGVHREA